MGSPSNGSLALYESKMHGLRPGSSKCESAINLTSPYIVTLKHLTRCSGRDYQICSPSLDSSRSRCPPARPLPLTSSWTTRRQQQEREERDKTRSRLETNKLTKSLHTLTQAQAESTRLLSVPSFIPVPNTILTKLVVHPSLAIRAPRRGCCDIDPWLLYILTPSPSKAHTHARTLWCGCC